MALTATTNPRSSGNNDTLSLLRERGYNAVETQYGKYCIDLGNGKKVEFEKWEPIWTVLNRIENALAENVKKIEDENIITKWKNEYLESSEEASQAANEAEIKENYFAKLLANAKKSLDKALEPFEKFNVREPEDLSKVETHTLGEKRALHDAEVEAEKCDGDIAEYKHLKQHYNSVAFSKSIKAFMDACSAMKFSYMG